ncbi:unnamed protein product [Vitrella brassicaformis CCMP3155]|uniref:Uncharacterized protein n=2 Tax=Vitrella brassicaformis TaxID=1169539 RepID=A0A0G4FY94_VITBC|nr:unnamed protein product [Vitrella brassicaformis CCMP3155]|eukprot:CEM20141.1 unnamed protein product [Vitrella brassicaformis CCMP3155]
MLSLFSWILLGGSAYLFFSSMSIFFADPAFRGFKGGDTKRDHGEHPLSFLNRFIALLRVYVKVLRQMLQVFLFKAYHVAYAVAFMLLSAEGKSKPKKVAPLMDGAAEPQKVESKTMIFFRHGESQWNYCFNRGFFNLSFPFRLLSSLYYEFILGFHLDSVFVDAPLSELGIRQSCEVRDFLTKGGTPASPATGVDGWTPLALDETIVPILKGTGGPPSVLVASNLRRALSTTLISFGERLSRSNEKILIHSALQEHTRNIDGISLAFPGDAPPTSLLESSLEALGVRNLYLTRLDASLNHGNKPIRSRVTKRLQSFAEWVFAYRPSVNGEEGISGTSGGPEVVIVGGHSGWFRHFFRAYMPGDVDHVAKRKKIVNGGMVRFTLQKRIIGEGVDYHIDPASVAVIYGGFAK